VQSAKNNGADFYEQTERQTEGRKIGSAQSR
jgi:hypothetical protein